MKTDTAASRLGVLPKTGPQTWLAATVLLTTTGSGLYLSSSALYLTRVVGMRVSLVGLALTAGALLGLTFGPFAGRLADRYGAREIYLAATLCAAAARLGFVFVRSFWTVLAVTCLTSIGTIAAQACRNPLARGFTEGQPTQFLAYLRSVTNLGIGVGSLLAAFAIQVDTRTAYVALLLASAIMFLGGSLALIRLPTLPPESVPPHHTRRSPTADPSYLTVAMLNGVMSLHYGVLVFALPLWIVDHTHAPRWLAPAGLLVNTVMVVLFQVRASRGVDSAQAAGRRMRWAGFGLLGGAALISGMAGLPGGWASALLVPAIVVFTVGELWQAAASFELSLVLAPVHAQAEYAGLFAVGQGLGTSAAPAVLAAVCLGWQGPGWLAFGALMMAIGLLTPSAVNWAQRTREPA